MSEPANRPRRRVGLTLFVCALIVAAAVASSYWIFQSEPTAQSERATRRSAALVETVVAERGTYRPRLRALGVVQAAQDVILSPSVRGQVVRVLPELVPGGRVRAGEELLRIDPADFEFQVQARESELLQVEAELAVEEGLQIVARQEYELLGEGIDPANRSLVLREPQIASIRARLAGARSALAQARLQLERATVVAPFDGQVLQRSVDVGSQVAPGDRLARIVGGNEYWIQASLRLSDLFWLRFPERSEAGANVRVRLATAWPEGVYREGTLATRIGTVDDDSRLANILVTVPDPLGLESDGPALILGTIVQLEIEGLPIQDVVRLDRDLVRQGETVWVMVDDALVIRQAELAYSDAEHAYVVSGVEPGEHVVATDLATVSNGLALRRSSASPPTEAPDETKP